MSGSGNKIINKRDALASLRNMKQKINQIMKKSTAIQRTIDSFLEDCGKGKSLHGEGFEAAENYFESTYKELLHDINSACALMAKKNDDLISKIQENITLSGHKEMNKSELEDEVKELKKEIERLSALMEKGNRICGGSIWADTDSRYSFYISLKEDQIEDLEEQIEKMDTLESTTSSYYKEIKTLFDSIGAAVDKICTNKYFNSKTGKFSTPNLELASARKALDEKVKDEKVNIEALDPVNMATGNYMYRKNFLEIFGVTPLLFEITYNSADNYKRRFSSAGWTHNYRSELVIYRNKIVVNTDSGRQETFLLQNDVFVNSDRDTTRQLVRLTSGEYVYKYSNEKHEQYFFDSEGRCIKKITTEGGAIHFKYDGFLLMELFTDYGTGYRFEYEIAEEDVPYIIKVSDHSGRKIEMEYEEIADEFSKTGNTRVLKAIRDEMDEIYKFKYNDLCKMYTVINARGTVNLINEYDASGRVTRQEFPDGGIITIEYYDYSKSVIATHQNGRKSNYQHDDRFRSTKTESAGGYEENAYNNRNDKISFRDRNGNVTHYEYDESGNIIREANPLGDLIETVYSEENKPLKIKLNGTVIAKFAYDECGNRISEADALGRVVKYEYNEIGLPVGIINPDGTKTTLKYDKRGNATEITDEIGNTLKFEYDALNRVISELDAKGNRYEFKYNDRNEMIEEINPLGEHRFYDYNESGKLIRVVDFDGYDEQLKYNELNKISAYIDKDGSITEYSYDKMWRVQNVTDPVGATLRHTYDSYGNLIMITDATLASITYSYDLCGNIIKVKDQEGVVTEYSYDKMNRLIKTTMSDGSTECYEYDAYGNEVKYIDAMGGIWIAEYDETGHKKKEINPEGTETTYIYDNNGNIIEERTQNIVVYYTYDEAGRLTEIVDSAGTHSVYEYDANNNIEKKIESGIEQLYEYDSLNRITSIYTAGSLTAKYEYDAVGNVVTTIDGLGNATRYVRTKAGHISAVIDPLGNVTRYKYDKAHRLLNIVQGEGDEADSIDLTLLDNIDEVMRINKGNSSIRITSYGRDILGRVTSVKDPLGNKETYMYNKRGEIVEKIDRDGNLTKVSRNIHGDVSGIKYADSSNVEYSYDAKRRLKEIKDSFGVTRIERDILGREIKITDHKGRAIKYKYDSFGNRTGIKYANGRDVIYKYDNNRLSSILSDEMETVLSYDENGRLSSRKMGIRETSYAYNETGLLDSLINKENDTILDSYKYSYDANGDIIRSEQIRKDMPEDTGVFGYKYDSLNRLTSVTKDGKPLRAYSYDAFGNRLSKAEQKKTIKYTYDKANQLISLTDGVNVTSFAYDRRGNLIRKIRGNSISEFGYNAANRFVSAVNSEGLSSSYIYNGLGLRVSRVEGNKSIDYILDQTMMYNNLLEEVSQETSNDYVWDGDTLIVKSNIPIYSDRLNTPIRVGDTACFYDEFGVPYEDIDGIGFIGYMHDEISDTYFAQAREYMPEIGRFAGRDIIKGNVEVPGRFNEYVYCHNNPKAFVDFNGMEETRDHSNLIEEVGKYARNQGVGIGGPLGGAEIKYRVKSNAIDNQYKAEKELLKNQLKGVREATGNPRAGSGKIGNLTKSKNAKLNSIKQEHDVSIMKVRDLSPSNIAKSSLKGGVIGGFVDTGFGLADDYSDGASTSKMMSNAVVNFGFGFTEGAIIAGATAIGGPVGLIVSVGLVFVLEYATDIRQTTKDSFNSLD